MEAWEMNDMATDESAWNAKPWWVRLSVMVGVGATRRIGTF